MSTGVVKKYFADKRFGFIRPDDQTDELFFHVSDVLDGSEPEPGTKVSYLGELGPRGARARDVRPL